MKWSVIICIFKEIDLWLKKNERTPALIVGIRQCGKTETIREFAARNRLDLIEINFWSNPEYCLDFDGKLDVDTIISNISLRFPNKKIDENKSIIFFDEIQDCPRARLSFKNFKNDGRYMVIGSGSYLGINGYVIGDSTPIPTGYEDVYQMKTMDFEELLWAMGYKNENVNSLVEYFNRREPIPSNINLIYKDLFLKYSCIGGFPKVILEYLKTKKIVEAYKVLNDTIFNMKTDFGRRKDKFGNPVFKSSEVARI